MIPDSADRIKVFLAQAISEGGKDVVARAARAFGISRQAVHKRLADMVSQGVVAAEGRTRARVYSLKTLALHRDRFEISTDLHEDVVWRQSFAERLSAYSDNVRGICNYGLTEILNNAIEHSAGRHVDTGLELTYANIRIWVQDDGIGVFKKLREGLRLADDREAILELSKGKATTDPARHTGEGIFFTSQMFDLFALSANRLTFLHRPAQEDWLIEDDNDGGANPGTLVQMKLSVWSPRTTKEVFDRYASSADFPGFDKTRVPVKLLRVGEENLVSRSQAKRLLDRFSSFKEVVLDFDGVDQIGQAFADEVFRVFATQHPAIAIIPLRAGDQVLNMIKRVMNR